MFCGAFIPAVKSITGIPPRLPRELGESGAGDCDAVGGKLTAAELAKESYGWVPSGIEADAAGGAEYALFACVLPVGGGGTRVAPPIGPNGINGWLVAGDNVPAGANGPFAALPICFWHPQNRPTARTDSDAVDFANWRLIAGLYSIGKRASKKRWISVQPLVANIKFCCDTERSITAFSGRGRRRESWPPAGSQSRLTCGALYENGPAPLREGPKCVENRLASQASATFSNRA
jgi:hypothetical protein